MYNSFSLHKSLLTPTDLVRATQKDSVQTLGPTNHNLLTGVIEFATPYKVAEMQAIICIETNLTDGLVKLLATGLEGWFCLCQQFGKANLIVRSGGSSARFLFQRLYFGASRVSWVLQSEKTQLKYWTHWTFSSPKKCKNPNKNIQNGRIGSAGG